MTTTGTLLVVEDNLETLRMMIQILQENGYRTLPANSGEIALKSLESQTPDLVLLDIRMPNLDGFEVCRRIKADARLQHLPVIFLSAEADRGERVDVFHVGAVDFVSKPFNQDELLARIRTHLELSNTRRRLAEANDKLTHSNTLLENEIAERLKTERENLRLIDELQSKLARIKRLEGIITICMYCKKIQNSENNWNQLERYICDHSEASFSHGICPHCVKEHFSELNL